MTLRRKILLVIGLPFFILLGIILFVSYNYLVVEEVPMYRVLGEFQEYYVLNLLIVGLFLVFGILVLVFLDRMLLKRFFQLRNSVSRIGVGGDFSRRVEVKGHDELADLAEEVNSMLVTLEWAHSELRESEKRFQRITDNMLDMIAQLNTDGIFLYVSPSHQSVLGYTKGQMVGEALVSFVHKADLKKVVDFLKAAAHNYALYKLEFRMKHVEGHNVWVESVGSYLRDKYGQVTGIILSSRDITDRKQAEGALKDSEEKHSQIVANIEEGYYEVDLAGKFTYFNNSLARIIGCGAEELQEKGSAVLSHDPQEVSRVMEQVLRTEKPVRGVVWRMTPDDVAEGFVEVSVSPIRDEQGEVVGCRGLVQDVTERKLHEEKIERLNEQLEQRVRERTAQLEAANKELESFSYSVSHDLRAPLRSLDGFSTALLEDYGPQLDDTGRDYLTRVKSASQRMGHLIDDLLNLSRVTRSEMESGEVNLSLLAQEIWAELQGRDPEREVELVTQPNVVVRGDPRLLRILMENLLSNAWKFTAKKPRAKVEFGAMLDGENMAYYVKDDGAGFEMEYVDKLFGPFQRLHSPEDFSGTGVGLATVARIVRRHGGGVWAEGAVDEGATFYFTL